MMSMDQRESKRNIMLWRIVMVDMGDQKEEEVLFLDHHLTSVSGCHTFNSFVLALPSE